MTTQWYAAKHKTRLSTLISEHHTPQHRPSGRVKENERMTQARQFRTTATGNTSDLMSALDAAKVPSDQNWENESTTWSFPDDSFIIIQGDDIYFGEARPE